MDWAPATCITAAMILMMRFFRSGLLIGFA
jgi:hypothetical protein